MNRFKSLNIVVSLALFVQTLFFQVAIHSLVICFGEDGHIAFEWNDNTIQCDFDDPVQHTDFNLGIKDYFERPENDCTDINLHFHKSFAEKSKNQKHPKIINESFLQNYFADLNKFSNHSFIKLQHINEINHILDNIQNTVLII